MHPIRRHILERLILKSRLRFSQLKPDNVESNHFIYYLKQLMGEDYVRKEGGYYRLSDNGIKYANVISLKDLKPRLQPKILTAEVCFRNHDSEVLLYRRCKEPYYGKITLVNGKLHYGERVEDSAKRELDEKTRLQADLQHTGIVYLNFFAEGSPVNHTLSHIFLGREPTGDLYFEDGVNEPFWHPTDKVGELDLLEGTKEILDIIHDPPFFFREFSFDVSGKTFRVY